MKSPAPAPTRRPRLDDPDDDMPVGADFEPQGDVFTRFEAKVDALWTPLASRFERMASAISKPFATGKTTIEAILGRGRTVAGIKAAVLFFGLLPAVWLAGSAIIDPVSLGANPAEHIIRELGDWTLKFLMLSLAITPLRRATGISGLIKFRRMLGLFAFFYGVIHLASYLAFDRFFVFNEIVADVIKRPFITVGFAALLLMTPLAITSTKGWIKRLGPARWNRLHRVVYFVAILGVVHYWWLVKRDLSEPIIYAVILAMLLGYRVMVAQSPKPRRVRAGEAHAVSSTANAIPAGSSKSRSGTKSL